MEAGNLHTVAFFGATGGCVLACLVQTLGAGICCSALVRDPAKLQDLLRQRGLFESAAADKLNIVKGSVTDIDAVCQTLIYKGRPVDMIISGVGGKPVFTNPFKPKLDNPTICQDAIRTILAASRKLGARPVLIAISSVGLTTKKRDSPIAMLPLNYWLLREPHADKKIMEEAIFDEMRRSEEDRAIRNYTLVRPSWFSDCPGVGLAKIKAGTEMNPAIGYTISRNDVGLWIFENFVRRPLQLDNPYLGQPVTITS
ncbi:hypothetical protein BDV26DRAFT_283625 [Aspergillus bertholletiae]|uniref:NAD(P)-binding domain-containing protein n=1 Tax=Aspergillus bertholletiae TaxID=1226010 RepID=A0A5N7B1I0_9EURO|nr:hypothetical protein BDV26DRAFT_283625 [Aspergillus bertholletiae]